VAGFLKRFASARGIVPLAPDNIPDDSASHLLSAGLVHTSATANVAVWITLIGTWTGMFTPSQIGDLSFRFTVNGVPAPSAAATPYITDAAGTAVAPSQAAFVLAGFKNLVGFGPNTYSASVRLGPLSLRPGGSSSKLRVSTSSFRTSRRPERDHVDQNSRMNSFLLLSALIGTTLIIVRSAALRPLRRLWPALFECSQCTGTWIGAAAGASGVVSTGHGRILDTVIVGAATSFLSLLADAVLLNLLGHPEEG